MAKMFCDGKDYDPDEEEDVTLLVLSGFRNGELHEFISRRLMPIKSCHERIKDWDSLTKEEKYVCISGDFIEKETKPKKITSFWIYGRYKTKKGCESYFADRFLRDNSLISQEN